MNITRNTLDPAKFNTSALLPYELRLEDFRLAVQDVYDFLFDVNTSSLGWGASIDVQTLHAIAARTATPCAGLREAKPLQRTATATSRLSASCPASSTARAK